MLSSSSMNKRVSSAKSRKEKKESANRRVIYDDVKSKKSLKIDPSKTNKRED